MEAAFVVTICVWVLAAICFGGLYVHDRVVLESNTNEMTAAWLSEEKREEKDIWVENVRRKLDDQLFLIQVHAVETQGLLQSQRVRVRYSLPVTWLFLKKALTGGKPETVFETVREDIVPAKYMWDAGLIKE